MDHSGHDHSTHMDHSGHGDMHSGHPGMGEGAPRCSMNMLFTWNTENLCIVFRQWHIHSTFSLVVSLLAIVALAAGYEALREGIRQYEAWTNKRVETTPHPREQYRDDDDDDDVEQQLEDEERLAETTMPWLLGQNVAAVTKRAHAIKSVLYGIQNFYAFMIMLIFMTYNGWVMLACSLGAALGYFVFGSRTTATKETACH
ncbi:Ctr copper transporter [Neurospora crassa]|uniref:Copper transport protein n=1 Tax=Neurospora crassa (strain ATCC 24698 / 74-OR23-1A / CBS 708.71 / DSM 1257 / FGSC 987) TaxID=367110 RepID=V5IPK5_NEUCR|nr:TCU-2 [Neurospora crassa OR74A]ESA44088.1 TCU-2 [Neurospora crassa OR74A]KHE78531.1 Ctr copper transporter [Neurospora crassa]|eukprot:XP_011393134.1 TCU-2 [Neurospora crassa OR74A]